MPEFYSRAATIAGEGLDTFTRAYIKAIYWTDTGDDEQRDSECTMASETIALIRQQCAEFQDINRDLLAGLDETQCGIDFWLTRNKHGSGFWDRGLGYRGDVLRSRSHAFGEVSAYVGDDGLLYVC